MPKVKAIKHQNFHFADIAKRTLSELTLQRYDADRCCECACRWRNYVLGGSCIIF